MASNMLLRQRNKINYAALNGTGRFVPPSLPTAQTMQENTELRSSQTTFGSATPKMDTRPQATPSSLSRSSLAAKQAEIDALEGQLEILALEEKLVELKVQVKEKQALVSHLTQPPLAPGHAAMFDIYGAQSQDSTTAGMPSYRAFLGLGARYDDCKYYDILQFVDPGISALGTAQGKSAASKMMPEKITPEWESELKGISHIAWSGASVKILSRLIDEGAIDTEGILQYLAYMLRISQLPAKYTWNNILLYDRRCRIMQASTKSAWDIEPGSVATTTLVPKRDNLKTSPPPGYRRVW